MKKLSETKHIDKHMKLVWKISIMQIYSWHIEILFSKNIFV